MLDRVDLEPVFFAPFVSSVMNVEPAWIDYNGHLRDAYYGLVMSYAIDDIMDHLGLDAPYRERTRCTLYTLELHMRYLHEVKSTDDLAVVYQHVGKMPRRECVRVALVIGLARQQGSEDRVPANGAIGGPFARRSHGPEVIALDGDDHLQMS